MIQEPNWTWGAGKSGDEECADTFDPHLYDSSGNSRRQHSHFDLSPIGLLSAMEMQLRVGKEMRPKREGRRIWLGTFCAAPTLMILSYRAEYRSIADPNFWQRLLPD
jgi:hypothetical protein